MSTRRRPLRALGPRTVFNYQRILRRAWPDSEYAAGILTPRAVDALPTALPPHVLGWPEGSKAQLRAAIVRIYEAAGQREAGENLAAQLPESLMRKRALYELPEAALAAFEAAASAASIRDRSLALLPLRAGFRSEELLALRRVDVERAIAGSQIVFVRKGGDEQALPSVGIKNLLTDLHGLPAAQPRAIAARSAVRVPWYVLGEVLAGKPATRATQYNLFNRLIHKLWKKAQAGSVDPSVRAVKKCGPHQLRHGFATRMMRAGAPITVIQAWLGHKNIGTTTAYLHVSAADLEKWAPR